MTRPVRDSAQVSCWRHIDEAAITSAAAARLGLPLQVVRATHSTRPRSQVWTAGLIRNMSRDRLASRKRGIQILRALTASPTRRR